MNSICKHCNKEFHKKEIANHSRWCLKNPNRKTYQDHLVKMRKNITQESRKLQGEAIKKIWQSGNTYKLPSFAGKKHSEESKKKIQAGALKSDHRRLKKGTIEYRGVLLDSSWEYILAKRLDELDIKWDRPNPLPWVDSVGVVHNYFPDFYLPDYDVYLDPKNPFAFSVQKTKIEILKKTYNNILFITTLEECKNFKITT